MHQPLLTNHRTLLSCFESFVVKKIWKKKLRPILGDESVRHEGKRKVLISNFILSLKISWIDHINHS